MNSTGRLYGKVQGGGVSIQSINISKLRVAPPVHLIESSSWHLLNEEINPPKITITIVLMDASRIKEEIDEQLERMEIKKVVRILEEEEEEGEGEEVLVVLRRPNLPKT